MRWLWKDWPRPVTTGQSKNVLLKAILQPGEDWQVVSGDYQSAGILAPDYEGNIVLRDATETRSWQIDSDGRLSPYTAIRQPYAGLAFGPDGRGYVTDADRSRIVAYTKEGKSSTIAKGIRGASLVVTHHGAIYVVDPGNENANSGTVWLVKPNGKKSRLDAGLSHPSGIAISPDGLWLAVAENKTHWNYSYRVQPDGTVQDKQRFYWFHVSDEADDSGAGLWVMDREGRLYAATRMGVQVFDRNGRSRLILPVPGGRSDGFEFWRGRL
jgi:sugar lactone lactonase YvrE